MDNIRLQPAETSNEERLVLRTEGLVKKYGKRTVVNGVSFDVKQGEIVGLLGPNGAGKTTSFYMTTGLVVPNGGRIFLGDQEITNFPVYKRAKAGIGYLAQEASVFRKMSVEDNIASVLEMTGKSKEEQRESLESLIKEFRLEKVRKTMAIVFLEANAEERKLPVVWPSTLNLLCSTNRLPVWTPLLSRIFNILSGSLKTATLAFSSQTITLKRRFASPIAPICSLRGASFFRERQRNWPTIRSSETSISQTRSS